MRLLLTLLHWAPPPSKSESAVAPTNQSAGVASNGKNEDDEDEHEDEDAIDKTSRKHFLCRRSRGAYEMNQKFACSSAPPQPCYIRQSCPLSLSLHAPSLSSVRSVQFNTVNRAAAVVVIVGFACNPSGFLLLLWQQLRCRCLHLCCCCDATIVAVDVVMFVVFVAIRFVLFI